MKKFLSIIFTIMYFSAWSQLGGSHTYSFLEIANSARIASLGGNFLSINDDDLTLAYSNPALINKEMSGKFALNYLKYFSDIGAGFVSYGQHFDNVGTFVATLQFMNYGTFTETNANGNEYGNFYAGDYAFTIGWAKKLSDRLNLGANIKNIYSQLYNYNSFGVAVDVAANYYVAKKDISSSLVFSNIGRQISSYNGINEPIPFNIKFGLSKRFEHAPIRIIFAADNLQKWDLTYSDPNKVVEIDPFTGQIINKKNSWDFGDKLMRHIALGGEFAPGKGNFALRLGYNYRRREEMKIASRGAMVGFSWGVGLKVYKFHLSYGRATYSLAGASNNITITSNISDFLK